MSGCYNCRKACTKRPGKSTEYAQHHSDYWCLEWIKYVPRDYSCEKYEPSE